MCGRQGTGCRATRWLRRSEAVSADARCTGPLPAPCSLAWAVCHAYHAELTAFRDKHLSHARTSRAGLRVAARLSRGSELICWSCASLPTLRCSLCASSGYLACSRCSSSRRLLCCAGSAQQGKSVSAGVGGAVRD
jgi:hypothetical protein